MKEITKMWRSRLIATIIFAIVAIILAFIPKAGTAAVGAALVAGVCAYGCASALISEKRIINKMDEDEDCECADLDNEDDGGEDQK